MTINELISSISEKIKAEIGMNSYDHDPVNHPSHYTSGDIECIEAIEEATKGLDGIEAFCIGNTMKYLWRWKQKNGVEDLKKAEWYLKFVIDLHENDDYID